MDGSTLLSIFLGVLAAAATLSAATTVVLSARTKQTIEGLRGDRDDQERRITRLEGEVAALQTENMALRQENNTLRTMKDATAAVQTLAEAITVADRGRQQEHHDIISAIQSINVVVTSGHDEVLAVIARTCHTHPDAA